MDPTSGVPGGGGGGGGRSAKNVHPPWQNPRYAPGSYGSVSGTLVLVNWGPETTVTSRVRYGGILGRTVPYLI
jgi:hypothetical protein